MKLGRSQLVAEGRPWGPLALLNLLFLSAHPSQPFSPRSLPKESALSCPTEGGPAYLLRTLSVPPGGSAQTVFAVLVLWLGVLFL